MRTFVALSLPEPVLDALEDLQDDLQVGRPMMRETLHITLAFLDEQDAATLGALDEELGGLRVAPFEVRLQGVGVFGGRQPRMAWAGVEASPALTALRNRVRRATRAAGIELARERFRPHVTLARFRKRMHPDEVAKTVRFLERNGGFAVEPFGVKAVTLFRSSLHSDGAVHEALAEYGLDG